MRSADALTTLEEVGSSQWGLVTTGQAESHGVSRVTLGRLQNRGSVHRVRRGVYSLPSAGHGPLQDLRAAWLATDSLTTAEDRVEDDVDVVASHTSAAAAHELGDLIPFFHEFTSTRRRESTHDDVRFHRGELPENDRALVDGLPVTSVPRTLEDLAAAGTDLDHFAELVRDALAKPAVSVDALASRLDHLAHRYGHHSGRELVDDCLNRAGLPTVAANLASTNALATAFVNQLPSHTALFDSLVRQGMSPQLTESINRVLGSVVSEQMSQLTAQNNSAVRAMQTQITAMMQKSLAPAFEAQARAAQPILEAAQRSAANSLRGIQVGRDLNPEKKHAEGADSPDSEDPSAQEEDPQT